MKAACWYGKKDVRVEEVPDPTILNPRDAVIKITSTAICGSDLHLYNGFIPTMMQGDILGHEFMGEVVEVGNRVRDLRIGDRVVSAFPISCGDCFFLSTRPLLVVRELQSQRLDGGEDVGPLAGRDLRLLAHARRIRGRPGRVRARPTPTSAC